MRGAVEIPAEIEIFFSIYISLGTPIYKHVQNARAIVTVTVNIIINKNTQTTQAFFLAPLPW